MSIPRPSLDPRLHGAIDAELKTLKILSRRLQSSLTILATELQVIQRLYYKNKNQHRGSLFWRNVVEVRRFMERIERLNLQGSLNDLRSKFYDNLQNVKSAKGPWTHCPGVHYLSDCSKQYQNALHLVEKTAERCVDAYSSFHRSLQSAAFLQILLMFVAVTSRTRALAMELREALQLVESSVGRLQNILAAGEGNNVNRNDVNTSGCLQQETRGRVNDPILNHVAITQDGALLLPETTASPPNVVVRNSTSKSTVVIEKVISTIPPTKKRKAMEQSKQDSKLEVPKKKKRTVARNEIDDIFGF